MSEVYKFSIAPMLRCTDRHFRYFARLLTKQSLLYTEMITTGAIIYGDQERLLKFNEVEHPVALQLGGSDPNEMAKCAEYAQQYNYNEVNINVGCPSERVQAGKFGACLMLEPKTVAKCITAMKTTTDLNVTVKTRIGVDDRDDYESLAKFVNVIANADCKTIIIHARKAYLKGLSPRQNRSVPPLRYEVVYQLKQDYPELNFVLNGGLKNLTDIKKHLGELDGVMVGREAYDNPFFLASIDKEIFDENVSNVSREQVLTQYKTYMKAELERKIPMKNLAQHIFGLFNGIPGARSWRRYLSDNIYQPGVGLEVIEQAFELVDSKQRIPAMS